MDLARIAAALADPMRISIVAMLAKTACKPGCCSGPGVCVCEFVERLGISQPRASYHLKILKEVGLVTERPRGKWNFYELNTQNISEYCRVLAEVAGAQRGVRDGAEQRIDP